jgi:hypothetical protein
VNGCVVLSNAWEHFAMLMKCLWAHGCWWTWRMVMYTALLSQHKAWSMMYVVAHPYTVYAAYPTHGCAII